MINSINYKYPTLEKIDTYPEFSERYVAKNSSVVDAFISKRNKTHVRSVTTQDRIKAGIGAIAGCILPMAYMMKKQKVKNPFKIHYGLSEMVVMSATSVAGGVAAGMLGEDKDTNKNKVKEGVFQFMNATVPTLLVGGALKLLEDNTKYKNSKPVKVAAIVTSLVAGMPLAAFLSNMINDPKDKEPDRKLTLKDSIINMDDALGALVVAKVPIVEHLHLDKFMPAIFAWCGYRAGQSN